MKSSENSARNRASLPRPRGAMGVSTAVFAAAFCFLLAACGGTTEPLVDGGGLGSEGGSPDGGNPDGGMLTCPALNGTELVHTIDITQNETWAGGARVHRVPHDIAVRRATLTLGACAVVKMGAEVSINLVGMPGQPAKLVSQGIENQPVLVTSVVPGQPWGQWRGFSSDDSADLSYTTLENGGDHTFLGTTLQLRSTGDATMVTPILRANHLTITRSKGMGLVMENGAAFTADSTQLTVTNSGDNINNAAIQIAPLPAGTLPPMIVSGNNRDEVRLVPATISQNLTLKKRGVPYHVFRDRLRVVGPGTPTLTIEPGVEIRFDSEDLRGDYLQVGEYTAGGVQRPARLIAIGTQNEPIVFTSARTHPAAGDWAGVYLLNAAGSRLQHVRIEYAGGWSGVSTANCRPNLTSDDAGLLLSALGSYIPSPSDFSDVLITDSASHGLNAIWLNGTFGPDLTAGFIFRNLRGCMQTRNSRPSGCGTERGCLR